MWPQAPSRFHNMYKLRPKRTSVFRESILHDTLIAGQFRGRLREEEMLQEVEP